MVSFMSPTVPCHSPASLARYCDSAIGAVFPRPGRNREGNQQQQRPRSRPAMDFALDSGKYGQASQVLFLLDIHLDDGLLAVCTLDLDLMGDSLASLQAAVKSKAWYRLTKHARQGMMDEHIEIGHRYPTVRLNTTYSFGLDDQEFVVAFESDKPEHFVNLVMELRHSEATSYTVRDTPTLTCVHRELHEVLDLLGG